MARRKPHAGRGNAEKTVKVSGTLKIVGGRLRGRPIAYLGDPRTRPMKQRVREAAFNLLGQRVSGTHVLDLFAGTGALTWEALSRGAKSATLIERHFPSARLIQQNAADLGLTDCIDVVPGDTFHWGRQVKQKGHDMPPNHRWLVFCSPPYELYVTQWDDMLQLIVTVAEQAPSQSLIVVESDKRLMPGQLPSMLEWECREYLPAVLWLAQKA